MDTDGVTKTRFHTTIRRFSFLFHSRNEPLTTSAGRTPSDALFELSVRADSALKTALCENNSMVTSTSTNDRITLRKSVSVMNQKQKVGSGRSLVRAKSDMAGADARLAE